jgi:hypothetical protein
MSIGSVSGFVGQQAAKVVTTLLAQSVCSLSEVDTDSDTNNHTNASDRNIRD